MRLKTDSRFNGIQIILSSHKLAFIWLLNVFWRIINFLYQHHHQISLENRYFFLKVFLAQIKGENSYGNKKGRFMQIYLTRRYSFSFKGPYHQLTSFWPKDYFTMQTPLMLNMRKAKKKVDELLIHFWDSKQFISVIPLLRNGNGYSSSVNLWNVYFIGRCI